MEETNTYYDYDYDYDDAARWFHRRILDAAADPKKAMSPFELMGTSSADASAVFDNSEDNKNTWRSVHGPPLVLSNLSTVQNVHGEVRDKIASAALLVKALARYKLVVSTNSIYSTSDDNVQWEQAAIAAERVLSKLDMHGAKGVMTLAEVLEIFTTAARESSADTLLRNGALLTADDYASLNNYFHAEDYGTNFNYDEGKKVTAQGDILNVESQNWWSAMM